MPFLTTIRNESKTSLMKMIYENYVVYVNSIPKIVLFVTNDVPFVLHMDTWL
ncbi:hypothetical protein OR571_05425 [Psychrobacillus sp. NEAU-3TGS]|uniref:hypothetical protein n=1 Tax=Psychrobacillus sp. NEAU-3TGS TaxID=2995412 RepID=UPI002498F880|nr:hypothetical protein [Psychrobacillus sp. NEAU-3TGS]MDI2586587.1 hypothetical protein [Psychrobacillus sp. NEAU-3TGS]